ncbi:MAG: nuclear transport factor 2 family protein [Solirubrobacterales bacterium]
MIAPHPYRSALENRDGQALMEALHPEVSFHSPAWSEPIVGRDKVMMLFAKLAEVFEYPVIIDELEGEGTRAIVFRLEVDGHPIEGTDYLELADDARVQRITVFMRPLASLEALANRMRETVSELQARSG